MAEPEPMVALEQIQGGPQLHPGRKVRTLGAEKAYHQNAFVRSCRAPGIPPHVACKQGVRARGLHGRSSTRAGYRLSHRIPKRVENFSGWIKSVGGWRGSQCRGRGRTQSWSYFVVGAYNLLRMVRLSLAGRGKACAAHRWLSQRAQEGRCG